MKKKRKENTCQGIEAVTSSSSFFASEREDNTAMCDFSHNGDTAKMRLVLR